MAANPSCCGADLGSRTHLSQGRVFAFGQGKKNVKEKESHPYNAADVRRDFSRGLRRHRTGVPLLRPRASVCKDGRLTPRAVSPAVLHTRPPAAKPLIRCVRCGDVCKGEVLRVQASHFHVACFTCKVCGCDLTHSGFFIKSGECLCPLDYQRLHGTVCNGCGGFVEGDAVAVLGKTYHPTCFVCTVCKQPFPAGDCVTFSGKERICQRCVNPLTPPPAGIRYATDCDGCRRRIKNGQALLALGGQWHLGCFKCAVCGQTLRGEYISKDGVPYCERDYQLRFGVQCDTCQKFITGKVLEAGDRRYHPECARCSRCDETFAEGQGVFLQGSSVWHPDCRESSGESSGNRDGRRSTRTWSESSCSGPASRSPGSPGRSICAKVDDQMIDYRDLAAIPRVKAIYDIEHPDTMSYESDGVGRGNAQDRKSSAEVKRPFTLISLSLSLREQSRSPNSASKLSSSSCLCLFFCF
uniref:LIM zinc-binding domain-containing protein n=1 Tax=Hippocampus comes TaxID=109280 RepID=A0A3Q3D493_HIPCM